MWSKEKHIQEDRQNLVLCSYGALDAKIASSSSFPSLSFLAVAGPTHDAHPAFSWSTTNVTPVPKFRPIDTFDFLPFNVTWAADGVKPKQ
jgi:hypothetical protein